MDERRSSEMDERPKLEESRMSEEEISLSPAAGRAGEPPTLYDYGNRKQDDKQMEDVVNSEIGVSSLLTR